MKINRVAGLSVVVLSAATIASVGIAGAHANTSGPKDSLATKIADKFNLNKDDVQKVLVEHHKEMDQKRQERMQTRLDQAVADKKLTQEQADKIKAKLKELHENRPDMSNKTTDERKTFMKEKKTELEKWAKDNNIPLEYLRLGHGPKGRHDHRHGMPNGPQTTQ
jgi:hypothetical protein